MDIIFKQIIFFLTEYNLVTIPLIAFFSLAFAFLTWRQIKHGWRFYFSKRRLIAQLREKKL